MPFSEFEIVENLREYILREFGLTDIHIQDNTTGFAGDETNSRGSATPGRPGFYFFS